MADSIPKSELKARIQQLAERAQGMHWREIRRMDPVLFDEIKRRYGSLKRAFARLGIDVRMKGGGRQKGPYKWTRESVLEHLRNLVAGRDSIEVMEIYRSGAYLYKKTIQYFGSVEAALREDPALQNVRLIRREKGRKPVPLSKETKQMLENLWRGAMDSEGAGGERQVSDSELLRSYIEAYSNPDEAAQFLKISPDELRRRLSRSSPQAGPS
ncbi:MAG: hypothetical protein HYY13_09200 [Nitrospirae bacterium]|nr:hypothetical protein [Nitrospirota bacterium]